MASVLHFFFCTKKMFGNKFLVRAHLPSPSFHPFRLLQLSVSDSSSSIEIETLCWKLSRRWRLACFHPSPSSVFIIYQRCQNEEAARVVEELAKSMAICKLGEEEEVRSAILIARAVECWFRSLMMEKSWRCIGESTFVDSTFAVDEEKKYFHALNARVQSEIDGIVFIVSPDVIWFIRDKITDLVSSWTLQSFHDGNVALVEKDRHFTACVTLPSLHSGHILGLSLLNPVGEKFKLLEELWKFKHGLSLLSDYYVNVHFSYGGQESKTWLPSAFVLRGSGLCPPPQTVRYSMALNALNSFINTIGCLDFFSQGPLKVKQVSSLESPMMQPVWKAVGTSCNENKNITDECITSQNLHLTLDFRAQKPAPSFTSANRMLGYDKNAAAVWTSDEITKNTSLLIPKSFNEVVHVATKPPLCQSQIYQRAKGDGTLNI
ncbi:uncharacterized protein LOC110018324 [Phalaenopsis equestris]|uniref:uncharacterized protein LOC110018324 n=1 Tax=Phalaenopsis equestris TaxID=78828 RepID=UPI0009E62167|nr:uncharacterized protein LOC110018324 [Phalaenopsis equestris]